MYRLQDARRNSRTADGRLKAPPASYIGRFAPSPTGPLHFGSLVSALASALHARSAGGRWLLRIEDLDPPREQPGAADSILRTLDRLGFEWDGPVVYQSARSGLYRAALEQLAANGRVYRCVCSRKGLRDASRRPVYSGTCRRRNIGPQREASVRVLTEPLSIAFSDEFRGHYAQQLERDVGDFVILRRDGQFAYQLAVVVDDAAQRITHVVRGSDLIECTPRQIYLQRLLELPTPRYAHHPVVLAEDGQKLSKQTGATGLDTYPPGRALCAAMRFLRHAPPPELVDEPTELIWQWAVQHWQSAVLRDAPDTTCNDPSWPD